MVWYGRYVAFAERERRGGGRSGGVELERRQTIQNLLIAVTQVYLSLV